MNKLQIKLIATGVILLILLITYLSMVKNHEVKAGQVAYVTQQYPFMKKELVGIYSGPTSTGIMLFTHADYVSITPYNRQETVERIQSADNLLVTIKVNIILRVPRREVQNFFENYASPEKDIDTTFNEAYASLVQEQFKQEVRTAIAQYKALEVKDNYPAISTSIMKNLKEKMNSGEIKAPFEIDAIVVADATPPESLLREINATATEQQKLKKKDAELNVAKREVEIQQQQGEAEAKRIEQVALGERAKKNAESDAIRYEQEQKAQGVLATYKAEADGQMLLAKARKEMNASIGENLIHYQFVENIGNLKLPHIYVGENIFDSLKKMFSRETETQK